MYITVNEIIDVSLNEELRKSDIYLSKYAVENNKPVSGFKF